MGCGCGGAKRREGQAQQAQQRRGGGSTTREAAPRPTDFNDPGYKWTGPKRSQPAQ